MELWTNKEECCGCMACHDICPKNAIYIYEDEEGFKYPKINHDKCINCGLCKKTCPLIENSIDIENYEKQVYAVKLKNMEERLTSRSGGAFVAFSDFILQKKGIIYGASFDESFLVSHKRADTKNKRDAIKGVKYVQSNTEDVFNLVKNDLLNGKYVLFTGTPCQIDGLKHYLNTLNISKDKLYTCDLVCHGTPSPGFWKNYLKSIEKRYNSKLINVSFRDKSFGWTPHVEAYWLKGVERKIVKNEYTKLFYQHIMFRASCYRCKYSSMNRVGDITLGDYWGIEKVDKDFNDEKGVSLILVNSKKGETLFNQCVENFYYIKSDIKTCLQPNLQKPSTPSTKRYQFWQDYKNKGFNYTLKKYTKPRNIKEVVKKILWVLGLRDCP